MDEGIKDEAKVANLFIRLGYFTRPHIQIYPSETTQKISDIDVFGVKFDRYLNRQVILVEVKKDSNRMVDLFKLFGFKAYYGNPTTYFISEKIREPFLDIAKSLGINVFSFIKLEEMSQLEGKEVEEKIIDRDILSVEKFLRIIRDEFDSEIYWKYHYLWLERNPYTRFFQIQQLFTKTKVPPEKMKVEVSWLRKELFIVAFLAHLDIANDCIGIETEKIDRYIREKFYEIGTPKEGKMKIKQGVDNLLSILKKLSAEQNQSIEWPTIDVIPKYLENLILLTKQTIKNAPYVNKYLLLNDLVYRANMHGKLIGIDGVVKSSAQARGLKDTNDLILRILHDGPIISDFNNFV
jgi:hypothetical protein